MIGALYNDNAGSAENGAAYVAFGKASGTTVDLDDVATGGSTLGFKILGEVSDSCAG